MHITVADKSKHHIVNVSEYVGEFSRRTEAPEVRCDLTDTHTDMATTVTLAAHACQGLIKE